MTAVEEYLEHAGTKGMKWGVRRAANSVSMGISSHNTKATNAVVNKLTNRIAIEKLSSKITGNGTSRIKNAAGNYVHNVARKGLGKSLNKANLTNFQSNQAVAAAVNRNSKHTSKLEQKVGKLSGAKKAKAQKNLDSWNAYSKSFSDRASKASSSANSSYSKLDSKKRSLDAVNQAKINKVNSSVYGKNKHGDTKQAIADQQKQVVQRANTVTKVAKIAAKVASGPAGGAASTALSAARIAASPNVSYYNKKRNRGVVIN